VVVVNRKVIPYLYLAPAIICLFAFWIFPFIYSLILSFQKWDLASSDPKEFIGFDNYREILADPEFWNSIWRTFIYVFSAVGIEIVLGLAIALLIATRSSLLVKIFKRLVLLPFLLAPVVVGLLWQWILNPEWGILNYFLKILHITDVGYTWTGDVKTAMPAIIFIDIWQWTPFVILLFMAGISSLPVQPYDAARVDGATRWQITRYITLPLLKYVMLLVILIRVMTAFKFIDIIFVLTHGGPASVTEVLGFYIYRVGFMHFNMGYASALCYVMFIAVIGLSILTIKLLSAK